MTLKAEDVYPLTNNTAALVMLGLGMSAAKPTPDGLIKQTVREVVETAGLELYLFDLRFMTGKPGAPNYYRGVFGVATEAGWKHGSDDRLTEIAYEHAAKMLSRDRHAPRISGKELRSTDLVHRMAVYYRPSREPILGAAMVSEMTPSKEFTVRVPNAGSQQRPVCGNCRFFEQRIGATPYEPQGRCKRKAPSLSLDGDAASWPSIQQPTNWCGEHEPIK